MGRLAAFALLLLAGAGAWALAQAAPAARFGFPDEAQWHAPTDLPPGAEYRLIREDPVTHGVQVLVRFPSGYAVPPHSHSCSETLVVLKGKLVATAGGRTVDLRPGDYAVFPAGTVHALRAEGWLRTVFIATTDGPYDLKPAPAPPRPAGR